MDSRRYKHTRYERIKSRRTVERLFPLHGAASGSDGKKPNGTVVYPLKAVWISRAREDGDAVCRILVSIPKRRIGHAVDRVKMRRRIREAYRLLKGDVFPDDTAQTHDVAFVYVADKLHDYATVRESVSRLLKKIAGRGKPVEASQ